MSLSLHTGHISVAFFLLGLPACLVIGVLADVVERKKLLEWLHTRPFFCST